MNATKAQDLALDPTVLVVAIPVIGALLGALIALVH